MADWPYVNSLVGAIGLSTSSKEDAAKGQEISQVPKKDIEDPPHPANPLLSAGSVQKASEELSPDNNTSLEVQVAAATFQLYSAGVAAFYAMTVILTYLPFQKEYGAQLEEVCEQGGNLSWLFPPTISASISMNGDLVATYTTGVFIVAGLLIMISQIGYPSLYPKLAGLGGAMFNSIRWMVPAFGVILLPVFKSQLTLDQQLTQANMASADYFNIAQGLHSKAGILMLAVTPLLETIHALICLVQFFWTRPFGADFRLERKDFGLPIYKCGWIFFQALRLVMTLSSLVSIVKFMQLGQGSGIPKAIFFEMMPEKVRAMLPEASGIDVAHWSECEHPLDLLAATSGCVDLDAFNEFFPAFAIPATNSWAALNNMFNFQNEMNCVKCTAVSVLCLAVTQMCQNPIKNQKFCLVAFFFFAILTLTYVWSAMSDVVMMADPWNRALPYLQQQWSNAQGILTLYNISDCGQFDVQTLGL